MIVCYFLGMADVMDHVTLLQHRACIISYFLAPFDVPSANMALRGGALHILCLPFIYLCGLPFPNN